MPWRVRAGTMSARAHSFLAQVRLPPGAEAGGPAARELPEVEGARRRGWDLRIRRASPRRRRGEEGSSGAGADLGSKNAIDAPWGATALADACVGWLGMGV